MALSPAQRTKQKPLPFVLSTGARRPLPPARKNLVRFCGSASHRQYWEPEGQEVPLFLLLGTAGSPEQESQKQRAPAKTRATSKALAKGDVPKLIPKPTAAQSISGNETAEDDSRKCGEGVSRFPLGASNQHERFFRNRRDFPAFYTKRIQQV